MKKTNRNGFVLLETLVATVFVSGVLIFLFAQFTSLTKKYDITNNYNSVEGIYALNTISNYILDDWSMYSKIEEQNNDYIDITDCSMFTNKDYCKKLFEYENIDLILVTSNKFDKNIVLDVDDDFIEFINQINIYKSNKEKYRLIAKFKNNSFATIRFGDNNE